jgi:hypothetical protein
MSDTDYGGRSEMRGVYEGCVLSNDPVRSPMSTTRNTHRVDGISGLTAVALADADTGLVRSALAPLALGRLGLAGHGPHEDVDKLLLDQRSAVEPLTHAVAPRQHVHVSTIGIPVKITCLPFVCFRAIWKVERLMKLIAHSVSFCNLGISTQHSPLQALSP